MSGVVVGGYTRCDEVRRRYIYALLFAGGRVYVGQSTNPLARIDQHAATVGGWGERFSPLLLEQLDGTELLAIDREYAWRWSAHLAGLTPITLFSKAPFNLDLVRDSAKRQAELRPWPSTT